MVIAIDGPGGVGKSTVARGVADALEVPYLDTGATYRAAALAVLRAGVDPSDAAGALGVLESTTITYENHTIQLGGEDVSAEVRSPRVTAGSSTIATIADVRAAVVALQRDWVADHGGRAVVEGRDIGTVVFPDAPVKAFLTARPEIRAARRAGDRDAAGRELSEIAADLEARDHADSTREASPLQPAADAVIIDTSDLGIDAVIAAVLRLVASAEAERTPGLPPG